VAEAKGILLRLDGIEAEVGNAYPIVTLSELHTGVAKKHEGDEKARTLAKGYAEVLAQRLKKHPEYQRIRKANEALTKYAVTGVWEPPIDQD